VAALVITDPAERQRLLEESHAQERLMMLATMLYRELDVLRLDQQITQKLHEEIEKNQKEHYLREKIRVIKKELGETTIRRRTLTASV
jgi:ATP-dependent Lon protease